ncbi:hypothetical protein CSUI_008518, partial [Cystoisospora suis]
MGKTCFETPLGRLQRLRMEVEEMLDFVSSFIVREQINESDLEMSSCNGSYTSSSGDGSSDSSHGGRREGKDKEREKERTGGGGGGLRTMYTQKMLTPEAKQTLLFGRDPLSLMSELDSLRMQILSVMNDPSLQRLFAGVEPTTGKKSGADLLLRHLNEVHYNLTHVSQICDFPSLSSSSSSSREAKKREESKDRLSLLAKEEEKQKKDEEKRPNGDGTENEKVGTTQKKGEGEKDAEDEEDQEEEKKKKDSKESGRGAILTTTETGAVGLDASSSSYSYSSSSSSSRHVSVKTQYDIYCIPSLTPLLESS